MAGRASREQRDFVVGRIDKAIDQNHRVLLPAFCTPMLSKPFYLVPWFDGCIRGMRLSDFEDFTDMLDGGVVSDSDEDRRIISRIMFSLTSEVYYDAQNRVNLDEPLREYASITDRVAVVSRGNFFELWAPEAFDTYLGHYRSGPDASLVKSLSSKLAGFLKKSDKKDAQPSAEEEIQEEE